MYCNYTKDKFDNNVSFVIPSWSENLQEVTFDTFEPDECPFPLDVKEIYLLKSWKQSEDNYFGMLNWFAVPQEARACLPLGAATEICVSGFEDAWRHFFDLRYRGTTGKPHPDMLCVATMLHKEFENRGINL